MIWRNRGQDGGWWRWGSWGYLPRPIGSYAVLALSCRHRDDVECRRQNFQQALAWRRHSPGHEARDEETPARIDRWPTFRTTCRAVRALLRSEAQACARRGTAPSRAARAGPSFFLLDPQRTPKRSSWSTCNNSTPPRPLHPHRNRTYNRQTWLPSPRPHAAPPSGWRGTSPQSAVRCNCLLNNPC